MLALTEEQASRRRAPLWFSEGRHHPDMMLLQELVWMHTDMVRGMVPMNSMMLMVAARLRLRRLEDYKNKTQ